MKRPVLKFRVLGLVAIFLLGYAPFHQASAMALDPSCEIELLKGSNTDEVFANGEFSRAALSYLFRLYREVQSSPSLLTQYAPEMRAKVALYRFFEVHMVPLLNQFASNRQLHATLSDVDELHELVAAEKYQLLQQLEDLKPELLDLLMDVLSWNGDSVIVEITRSQDQQVNYPVLANFAKMYEAFARRQRWQIEVLDESPAEGGIRHRVMRIKGKNVGRWLKFENGVHRYIQIGGDYGASQLNRDRVHTSYASVHVYPEPNSRQLTFDPRDVEISVARASGPGGQHVNRTESAVRAKHLPTGIEVHISDERSQHRNRESALSILRARVFAKYEEERAAQRAALRRNAGKEVEMPDRYVRTYDRRHNSNGVDAYLAGGLKDSIEQRLQQALSILLDESAL